MSARKSPDGEGSIFPRGRGGWGAYVWVTRADGSRTRRYVYGQDFEKVQARWQQMKSQTGQPSPVFPEHAKVKFGDQEIVFSFMDFLRDQGITDLDWQEVFDLMLAWRGVDRIKYELETEQMKKMFPKLWAQYGLFDEEPEAPKLRVTRKEQPTPEPEVQASPHPGSGLDFLLAKIRQGE